MLESNPAFHTQQLATGNPALFFRHGAGPPDANHRHAAGGVKEAQHRAATAAAQRRRAAVDHRLRPFPRGTSLRPPGSGDRRARRGHGRRCIADGGDGGTLGYRRTGGTRWNEVVGTWNNGPPRPTPQLSRPGPVDHARVKPGKRSGVRRVFWLNVFGFSAVSNDVNENDVTVMCLEALPTLFLRARGQRESLATELEGEKTPDLCWPRSGCSGHPVIGSLFSGCSSGRFLQQGCLLSISIFPFRWFVGSRSISTNTGTVKVLIVACTSPSIQDLAYGVLRIRPHRRC